MHDQPHKDELVDRIIDHPQNRGRDGGELHEMRKKLKCLTPEELIQRKRKLDLRSH